MHVLRSAFLSLGVLHLSLTGALAAPVTLYDGTSLPTDQGWSRTTIGGTVTVNGDGTTTFLTGPYDAGTSEVNLYTYATGATDYVASIRLQVLSTSFNQYDPALVFSAFGSTSSFGTDRHNSFAIDNGAVRWSDAAGSVAVDTSAFREYALRYVGGTLSFYIDQPFASVVDGTATAVLTRSSFTPNGDVGRIAFGDFTNDPGYDSHFIVDFVRFENLTSTPLPEPAGLTMLGLAFAGVAARRRASMAGRRK